MVLILGLVAQAAAVTFQDAEAARGRGDYAIALRLYRSLAELGDIGAQWRLAVMCYQGQGMPQNYAEAAKWYRIVAERGIAGAQGMLGLMYEDGEGVPQSYAEAAKWYHLAAEQGDVGAQTLLAHLYHEGKGVSQSYNEAAKWYRLAAEQGNAHAQIRLAGLCYRGRGVTQSFTEAAKWYRLSAEQGNAEGQTLLGFMYEEGTGVGRSNAEAAKWYRLAAEQGDAGAQHNLAHLYQRGMGVPQNYVTAHMWFSLAAAHGDQDALRIRDILAAMMTPAQVAEAQLRATEWQPKNPNASLAEITPRSHSSEKSEMAATAGTGFFVSGDGKALTNAHVVAKCQQIRVAGASARLLARDGTNDLALLATDVHSAQWANWRQTVKQGEDIVAYGFPLAGVLSSGGNVVTGNVTALAGLGDDSRFLQISAPVQPGNSGGPLFDRYGNVVGVVVAKLDAVKIASANGDIPQNVNFAIKASVASAFLEGQNVERSEPPSTPRSLSTPEVAKLAHGIVVQVVCIQ